MYPSLIRLTRIGVIPVAPFTSSWMTVVVGTVDPSTVVRCSGIPFSTYACPGTSLSVATCSAFLRASSMACSIAGLAETAMLPDRVMVADLIWSRATPVTLASRAFTL
jgi:hypothetical protein